MKIYINPIKNISNEPNGNNYNIIDKETMNYIKSYIPQTNKSVLAKPQNFIEASSINFHKELNVINPKVIKNTS